MMDAARPTQADSGVITAAFTAAPVVGRVIQRAGSLLGVIPDTSRDLDTTELMPPVAAPSAAH
jgi:cell division protein FtsI (penicillin-binding protein 3)